MQRPTTARAALFVAVAALVLATAGGAIANNKGDHSSKRFTVYDREVSSSFVDLGAKGPTPGDEFVFTNDVFSDAGFKHKVGALRGVCTLVDASFSECGVTLRLRGGDVQVNGLVEDAPGSFSVPITGGTGHYRGKNGEVRVTPLNADSSESKDVLIFVR
jgi:hypothetical protein